MYEKDRYLFISNSYVNSIVGLTVFGHHKERKKTSEIISTIIHKNKMFNNLHLLLKWEGKKRRPELLTVETAW